MLLSFAGTVFGQTPRMPQADVVVVPEANKKALLEFFRLAADREARMRMLTTDYVQHNPRFLAMDAITRKKGREAWGAAGLAAVGHARLTDTDFSLRSVPVILMAEGDYVTGIFKAVITDPDDHSKNYEAFNFETVRVRNGMLAEHWDAVKLERGWKTELEGRSAPAAVSAPAPPPVSIEMTVPRSQPNPDRAKLDANKKLLMEFLRLRPNPRAASKLFAENYVEHNPRALAINERRGKNAPDPARAMDADFARSATVVVMAEGDYVCAILKAALPDPDDGTKTYEAFSFEAARVKEGKLAEHWAAVKLTPGWMLSGRPADLGKSVR